MRSFRIVVAVLGVGGLVACAARQSPPVAPAPASATADPAARTAVAMPKGRADLIIEGEIAAIAGQVQTAFEIVQRLRPTMLRLRAGSTTGSSNGTSSTNVNSARIMVYMDNQPMGGIEGLREIMTSQVREIRYLNANDATTLFGTGHQAGAIVVLGKR